MIYLDYAATTPMRIEALNAYKEAALKFYGNASSLHDIGTKANDILNICRMSLAKLINGTSDGIYFTSGGSEANILAVRSLLRGNKHKGNHIITTEVEHSSLFYLFNELEQAGYEITYLPINEVGKICLRELKDSIKDSTVLVSIHHGNPEIGVMQDLQAIGKILHEAKVIFHTDCVQTFGNEMIDVQENYIDSLSISSHKIYGPKGTGMCYISPKVNWKPVIENTSHEKGFRPGTVDVPNIVAFTTAADLIVSEMDKNNKHYKNLREYLIAKLFKIENKVRIVGSSHQQLSHIVGLTISQLQGQYTMLECNRHGIAISTGSACQVGMQSPSRTMRSMGKSIEQAQQFIRVSFGRSTTKKDLEKFTNILREILT